MSATPVVTTPFAPVQDDEEFVTFTGLRALDEEDLVFHDAEAQDDEEFVTFTGLRALDEEDLVFHDEDESLMMASV